MLEYSSEKTAIKILPERIYFVFDESDLGRTMKRNIKVYNTVSSSLKINILPSETELFMFKHKCVNKLVPGIPLTISIEFRPIEEREYTDRLRICYQNDSSITLPLMAVLNTARKLTLTDTCKENTSFVSRPSRCLTVIGNKNIKHVKKNKRYRKIIRFKIDSDIPHEKEQRSIFSKYLKKFTQHDVNIALMKRKPIPIRDPNEQLGPDGLFQDEYLSMRKKFEEVFIEKVREIQLLDSCVERNSSVLRLFNSEMSSEEIEKVENYRGMQTSNEKEIFAANEATHPIYLRQKLITNCDQIIDWRPPNQVPDLWIFRYEALWKFIQAARSILVLNRLLKRLEKLKVLVLFGLKLP